jgi:glycosyl transferase family 2
LVFEAIYLAAVVALCVVGLHRLLLLVASAGSGDWMRTRTSGVDPAARGEAPPFVTVQLPIYNERFVVAELLRAIEELDYPRERLEVQVLDDSTDATSELVATLTADLRGRGLSVHHLRRSSRVGFKAGALAHGLEQARGELIAVFDADFTPPPDLLREMVIHFADREVGLVQARWGHTNRDASMLTRIQAMQLDGHFLVEHLGRQNAGLLFNFNGTAGMLRRTAIETAGGWQSETLTEDLDLSCRVQMAGWRFVYRRDLVVPSQLPESMGAYKAQQRRWTQGSAQTARKLLLPLWRSTLPLRQKLEASALLLGNASYPLLVLFALLHAIAWTSTDRSPGAVGRILDTGVLGASTAVLWAFYAAAAVRADRGALPALVEVPALIALGAGMGLNNAIAFLQGLLGGEGIFQRTPKRAPGGAEATYRPQLGPSLWLELPLGAGALWCASVFLTRGWLGSAFFYLLFAAGLGYVGVRSFAELWSPRRRRRAASATSATHTGMYSTATTQAFSSQTPAAR